jgi:hypothetical protein
VLKFCHPEDIESECAHWNDIYGDEEEEDDSEDE